VPQGPAARLGDAVVHPTPPILTGGPPAVTVLIGGQPAWKGIPLAAAPGIMATSTSTQATLQTLETTALAAEAAAVAAAGTPGAPTAVATATAARLAAETAKATSAATNSATIVAAAAGGASMHTCALPWPIPPHGPGVVIDGSATVMIENCPACRMGDTIIEAIGPPNKIVMGCMTVIIGAQPYIPSLDAIANAVNPAGSVINCGNIVDAVIARLSGSDPDAVSPATQDGSFDDIGNRHGTTIEFGHTFQDAFDAVRAGGPGTTAIVGINYSGGTASHIVVMTNEGGNVAIVEGQDWGAGNSREVIGSSERANERYNSDAGSDIGYGIVPGMGGGGH